MNSKNPDNYQFSIAAGFIRSAERFPNRTALCINDESFTYRQLFDLSKRVYAGIVSRPASDIVGIYCADSVWTYAAIIAVSASGACYLPLNPPAGEAKLQQQLEQARPGFIISSEKLRFVPENQQLLSTSLPPEHDQMKELVQQDFSYLLYTSGSTGMPKGVPVKKESLAAFFSYFKNFDFSERDRFLQPYELSWDVSVFCLLAAWHNGASLYVVPSSGIRAVQVFDFIERYGLTVSPMVPSVLGYMERYLSEMNFPHLRHCFFAGEALSWLHVSRFAACAPHARIFNFYGPTEATIYASGYEIKRDQMASAGVVPIGRLLPGFDFFIESENGTRSKSGKGLLFLAGPQVIDNYLQNADGSVFVNHEGAKYYNTGDLVQLNSSGDLEFTGRADSQVKINGYRVELQEVASLVQSYCGQEAIARYLNLSGRFQLVAFVRAVGVSPEDLLKLLRKNLPAHLCPHKVFTLMHFPLLSNGKTDLARLDQFVHEQFPAR